MATDITGGNRKRKSPGSQPYGDRFTAVCPGSFHSSAGYHALVSTILAQAEKEILIPYNPAAKATPPKTDDHDPNYFQPEEIAQIWEAGGKADQMEDDGTLVFSDGMPSG